MTATARIVSARDLLLPALLLAGLAAFLAGQSGLVTLPQATTLAPPATVVIPPHSFSYRANGEYLRDGYFETAPLVTVTDAPALEIMTFEVTASDYARCVADGECRAAEPRRKGFGDVPATGVNFEDANAYAAWLSKATGSTWRLPSLEEWVFAAGSQVVDPALLAETDNRNPAERWLAQYQKEAALGINALAAPEPGGTFGVNEYGVADIDGSVWEWTSTCNARTHLDAAGNVLSQLDSCGVRVLEGRHRAAMSYFIRDGKSGGCAVGAPPDNLGFRLVREPAWYEPVLRFFSGGR